MGQQSFFASGTRTIHFWYGTLVPRNTPDNSYPPEVVILRAFCSYFWMNEETVIGNSPIILQWWGGTNNMFTQFVLKKQQYAFGVHVGLIDWFFPQRGKYGCAQGQETVLGNQLESERRTVGNIRYLWLHNPLLSRTEYGLKKWQVWLFWPTAVLQIHHTQACLNYIHRLGKFYIRHLGEMKFKKQLRSFARNIWRKETAKAKPSILGNSSITRWSTSLEFIGYHLL